MPFSYVELGLLLGTQIAELSAEAELSALEIVLGWLLRLE